jgi:hypothetical protein
MPVTRSQSVTASERAESVNAETTPIKWSTHHQSPRAEVILVSSDNVSFRVNVWYLKQKRYARQWILVVRLIISGFISDLLEIPSSQSFESAPIQLDQVSRHVEIFVELVVSSGQNTVHIAFDDCVPLLDLCDHLQGPAISSRVWQAFTRGLETTKLFKNLSPWDIFKMAANRGDGYACGKAIAAFQVHGYLFGDIIQKPPDFYHGIPTRYLATLLNGNYGFKIKHGGIRTYVPVGWAEVAVRFYKLIKEGSVLAVGTGR